MAIKTKLIPWTDEEKQLLETVRREFPKGKTVNWQAASAANSPELRRLLQGDRQFKTIKAYASYRFVTKAKRDKRSNRRNGNIEHVQSVFAPASPGKPESPQDEKDGIMNDMERKLRKLTNEVDGLRRLAQSLNFCPCCGFGLAKIKAATEL
jgi:hypothetical protein